MGTSNDNEANDDRKLASKAIFPVLLLTAEKLLHYNAVFENFLNFLQKVPFKSW